MIAGLKIQHRDNLHNLQQLVLTYQQILRVMLTIIQEHMQHGIGRLMEEQQLPIIMVL